MKFATLLTLASVVLANSDTPGDQAFVNTSAVSLALGHAVNFGVNPGETNLEYYTNYWNCPQYIATLCIWYKAVLKDDKTWKKALEEQIVKTYNEYGKLSISLDDVIRVYENGTKYVETPKNVSAIAYAPAPFNQTAYVNYYPSVKEFYTQVDLGTYYGAGLCAYWLAIFLIGMSTNLAKHAFFSVYQKMKGHRFRKHVSLPALWGYKHCQTSGGWLGGFFTMCTPTRAQALAVTGYLIMSFIFCFTQYNLFQPNFYFPTNGEQLARYIADRTGIMSMTQIPVVFLFGGRNNFFMWLTGWSFDTFNVYHRYTSRVMVVYAVIHSICYSYIERGQYFATAASQFYWIMGTVATICGSLILFQGIHFFRSRWYETFLVIHLVLAVAFVVGMWYHCVTLGWMQWMYATIAVWSFDRFMRIVRICWSGFVVSGDFELVDPDQLIVKAEMDYSRWWSIYPGVHVYIYILNGKFWESHPFTVYQSPYAEETGKMTVLLKAKEGKTLSLANLLAKGGGKRRLRTLIEGPYGSKHPVGKYDSSIYVAGGIGITATYSYAIDVVKKSTAKNLIFTWVVRNETCLTWFRSELDTLLADPRVEVNLYVTGNNTDIPPLAGSESDSKTSEKSVLETSPRLNLIYGRPDMTVEMPAYIERCSGTTAIVVCGPPVLNDDIRLSLVQSADCSKVDYYEEAFSW
ncbi:Ferric reductase transmembrane component 3 [Yarrowia sp. B02]|nr:Ferric reductase transmembrane component 3 [Yarrowia sp. B02]